MIYICNIEVGKICYNFNISIKKEKSAMMKKRLFGIIIILVLIGSFLTLTVKEENYSSSAEGSNRMSDNTTEIVQTSTQGLVIHANELIKDSTAEEDMGHNTEYLQNLIDTVSDIGGGVVHIPAGTFYFTSGGINSRGSENYVIKSRDNVLVEGEGSNEITGTILKPYGNPKNGLDMFYYNQFRDTYGADTTYIVNADFRNFVIDGEMATGQVYNTSGKGFMLNLYKNCDWENVVVKNTDATGFGMDNPINCTVKNCIAINCGKNATTNSAGASGFGIGTGLTEEDSIIISNCTAIGNKKYGFFFEHQGRFQTYYRATKSESLVVSNCQAKGNLYNFGGARGNDITYENCTSLEEDSNSANRAAFYFEQVSRRINLTNCNVEKTFNDVTDTSKYYYDAVYWALNNSITDGTTMTTFSPETQCNRRHALAFLYRMIGRPGEVFFGEFNKERNAESMEQAFRTRFTDIDVDASCVDAIKWADDEGIIDFFGTEFLPDAACSKETFITILWKYAGEPIVETGNNFSDVEQGSIYENAVNWALSRGIIEENSTGKFEPNSACTRADIVTYLYRYYNSCDTYSITYNLNQGENAQENPTVYKTGVDTFTLNEPTKEGYIFDGWTGSNYTQEGYIGIDYKPEKVVTITEEDKGNKVYTANWTPIQYIVTFDSNLAGGYMEPQTFKYDCPQILPENQFKNEGYYFKEWNTKADGTGRAFKDKEVVNNIIQLDDLIQMEEKKVILYAQWELPNPNNRDNIFIGSSTFVEMHNIVGGNETWIAARGEGIDWVKNTAIPSIENQIGDRTNVIIRISGNDLFNKYLNNGEVDIDRLVEIYAEYFNAKAIEYTKKGADVYFVGAGPVDDSKIDFTTRKINNADTVEFNNKLQTKLEGITFIDVYSKIINDFNAKNPDLTRDDGSHGTALYYSKVYGIIKQALGQDYVPTYEAFNDMTDVPSNANYIVPLKWAYENAFIDPISKNEFKADKECTRAEVITAIWRSQGIPYDNTTLTFTDVSKNALYRDAIMWGVKNNIVSGKTNSTFAPDELCKRGHFIIFIWRVAGKPIVSTGNNFTDVDAKEIYIDAINWAVSEGIINKDLNGEFRPEDACTREDIITFLYNSKNNYHITYNLDEGILEDENPSTYIHGMDEISLNNPIKEGYEFIGWTGSNGEEPQTEVTITKGTIGDLEYTANWEATEIEYKVAHYKQNINETYPDNAEETETFKANIGTSVTPETKTYEGFTAPEKQTVEVAEDGEIVIKYYYTRNSYTVTVDVGTGIESVTGEGTYKYEEKITLEATLTEGYENITWTGDYTTNIFNMPAKDVKLQVNSQEIKCTVTSSKYNISQSYILDISENTPVEIFKNNIETNAEQIQILNKNNEELDSEDIIGTGMTLILKRGNKKLTYKLVIKGDLNGDGKVKLSDLSKLKLTIVGSHSLDGAYKIAADLNGDGNVKLSDLSKMKLYLVGKV